MSKNTSEKGTTPNTKKLEECVDQLAFDIEEADKAADGDITVGVAEARFIRESLRWLCEFLNDRKLYHKKQQLKKRLIEKLVREKLSPDEIAALNKAAGTLAEKSFDTDEEGE